MADTITFRPSTAARAALDKATKDGSKRTPHINAALEAWFGVADSDPETVPVAAGEPSGRGRRKKSTARRDDTHSGTEQTQAGRVGKPPRGAPASVAPSTLVEDAAGNCLHPRGSRIDLGYATRCRDCGHVIRR